MRALPGAAVVVYDDAEMGGEVRDLTRPEGAHPAEPGHQQQGRSATVLLVVQLGVADGDRWHRQPLVLFIPISRSMSTTSWRRAKGAGAGSPAWRQRPMVAKKFSSPGGVMIQMKTRSSLPSFQISCLTSYPRKHEVPGTRGWLAPSTMMWPRPRKHISSST